MSARWCRVRRIFDGAVLEIPYSSLRWAEDDGTAAALFRDSEVHTDQRPGRLPVVTSEIELLYDRVVILEEIDPPASALEEAPLPRARNLRPATAAGEREVRGLGAVMASALRKLMPGRRLPR